MRKLKLDAESLRVESFAAHVRDAGEQGTVAARSFVTYDGINPCSEPASAQCQPSNIHLNTCGTSCIMKCFNTGVQYGCGW